MIRRERGKSKNSCKKSKKKKSSVRYWFKRRFSKRIRRLSMCVICTLMVLLGGISYASGVVNPLVGIRGIYLMSEGSRKIHKLSDMPLVYICSSFADFTLQMMSEQYIVIDKGGRYFELRKSGEIITLKSKDFLGIYEVIREVDRR